MPPVVRISNDPAHALASRLAELIQRALDERGTASIAFSGGSSPLAAFEALGGRGLPWDRVHAFQVDERVAPPGHPDRNLVAQRHALPALLWHPMPVELTDIDEAARRYDAELAHVLGPDRVLDVVHLGLGSDGHTASWPPGRPLPNSAAMADVAAVEPFNGRSRLTLTPACVNRARSICWLVPGSGRQLVLGQVLAGDARHPASAVRGEPFVEVFTDRWPVTYADHRDPAVSGDLVTLQRESYAVEAQLIGHDQMPGLIEDATELARRALTFLTVTDGGRQLGAIGFTVADRVVDIDRLVVDPASFRRGVGRSLLLAVHDIEATATRFEVSTAARNQPAIALYESCGYSTSRTEVSDGVELVHLVRLPSTG